MEKAKSNAEDDAKSNAKDNTKSDTKDNAKSNTKDNVKSNAEDNPKIFTRIAWYDRECCKYDFGEWQDMTDKDYDTISAWVDGQNKKIPRVKYWIEATDKIKGKAKNAESYQFIPIVKEGLGNTTEWVAI